MKRTVNQCIKCNRNISLSNYNKHTISCKGIKVKKVRGVDFDPNIGFKNGTRKAWNYGLTKETDKRIKKYGSTCSKKFKKGETIPSGCFGWSREKRSEHAKKIKLGGYRERSGRSKKTYLSDSFGKRTCLQSSYEVLCSKVLNKLNIKWVRPKCLYYDNHTKRYFPDFYLTDYDIYLDPKNDYLIKLDKEKIQKVIEENKVKLYVLSKEQLTEKYIQLILQMAER